ncbi:MAG: P-II family nitrogen regulator [Oscillospiraceae bacterium]|nr:P-II family nitrogen regulator [Oscillospiraceae bacterium]
MSELSLMVTITGRKMDRKFVDFYQKAGLPVSYVTVGNGTASSEILDYFGLDGSEKSILFQVITDTKWKTVKRQLRLTMNIDVPGVGIVFLVPLSSIGGAKALNYLTAMQDYAKGEESTLKETKFELLVAIANQGYNQKIMDAARRAGAGGGTVIHAKGTGTQLAEQFMGVTLVPEKEMVFIVTRTGQKNAIMRAIMDEAGTGTKAGAIVFSLPVTDTACMGLRMMEDPED